MNIDTRIEKNQKATFEGTKPIVPGFFRIGIQSETIPGRSAYNDLAQDLSLKIDILLGVLRGRIPRKDPAEGFPQWY